MHAQAYTQTSKQQKHRFVRTEGLSTQQKTPPGLHTKENKQTKTVKAEISCVRHVA